VAGGLIGGVIYTATTQISGRDWNNNDFLVSVGIGAVGGALIGTGIGAVAGVTTLHQLVLDQG
jgi:hypothetical protein